MKAAKQCSLAIVLVMGAVLAISGQTPTSKGIAPADENEPRLKSLLERVGQRVQEYHDATFSVAFTAIPNL